MTMQARTAGRIFVIWAAALALALVWALPVSAHHKDGHSGGGKPSSESTEVTEDNDNDGQPNSYSGGESKHPSGKDRHIESGKSGNQGKSKSHPDDSKGPQRFEGERGADKPTSGSGSLGGGTNVYDQDGNNGCGNDQDFDDDNNGWCGRNPKKGGSKPEQTKPEIVTPSDPKIETPITQPVQPEVGGEVIASPEKPAVDDAELRTDEAVAGTRFAKRAAVLGSVLPFTGASLVPFLGAAFALMGAGAMLARRRR